MMMVHTFKARALAMVGVAALLAACGGGGGDAAPVAASAVDKYVGTWSTCFTESGASARATLVVAKTSDTAATFSLSATGHANTDCSGAVVTTQSSAGTVTLAGTKAIGSDTVDKVNIVEGSTTEKQVFAIQSGKLVTGRDAEDGGTVDAQGYPNTLDTSFTLAKQ